MPFLDKNTALYADLFPVKQPTLLFLKQFTGKILDVGCGPGLYTRALSDRQHDVVGIDSSADMIGYARQHHPPGTYRCMDLRDIDTMTTRFDMVFAIGNVVSFLGPDDLTTFSGKLMRILKPGGDWILQVVNWDYLLQRRDYAFPDLYGQTKPVKLVRRYLEISESTAIFETELFYENQCLTKQRNRLYPQKASSLIKIHKKSGFSNAGCYADFTGTVWSENSNSASIFVFKKERE